MLLSAGMPELAAEVYRRIAVVAPSNLTAAQNHAFLANYSDGLSSEEIFDIHRQTARAIERAYAQSKLPSVESRPVEHAGRRRVGFLSADLRAHPVGYFAFPILESISKDHFELFFYSTSGGRDWLNEKIRAIADHWVDCETFDHEALIECIAADGLDVLIDLSGHSAGNRLFLMTGQLAPVQASWVGYFNTTGLRAVQYQIMDHATVPPSEERWFSETVLKLNRSRFGYIPPPYSPDVAPTPALANGYVTFGSFNNIAKYSETTLQIWAQILDRLPTARLILKWGALSDAPIRAALVNRWQRAGGDLNRLEIRVGSPHAEMLAEYGDIDIALDPTPFCGGLTTAEALWMGVPVISLVGQRPVARQGFALLRAAHLDQCAALDAEDYISKAIAMATKLNDLQALRLNMRTQLMASPLMDGPGLARDFEEVLQMMKPTRLHSLTTGAVSR
jgi:predicted O-linked N-acetylglucosamine transferase (SPINDLY family)